MGSVGSESVISLQQLSKIQDFVRDINSVVTQIRSFIADSWGNKDIVKANLIFLRGAIELLLEEVGGEQGELAQFKNSLNDVYKEQDILTYDDKKDKSTEVTNNQKQQKKLISDVLNDIFVTLKKIAMFNLVMAPEIIDINRLDVSDRKKEHLRLNYLMQPVSEYYMHELNKMTVSMTGGARRILRNTKSRRYRGNRPPKQLLYSRKSIKIRKSRKSRKYKKT